MTKQNNSKYNPDVVTAICNCLAKGDNIKLAIAKGGIDYTTFERWKNSKPEFAEMVRQAQDEYREWKYNEAKKDAETSLMRLVRGEEVTETETEYIRNAEDPNNPIIKSQKIKKRHILPNVTAIIFTLVNRAPEHWKNRMSNEITGEVRTDSKTSIDMSKVPDELLAKLVESIKGKE